MTNENYSSSIRNIVLSMDEGQVFAIRDLEHVCTYDALRKTLTRLCEIKLVSRIVPGIYCAKPPSDDFIPIPTDVIQALARNSHWSVIPGTEEARYLLGITKQKPEKIVYFSTGPSSHYEYQGVRIRLRHAGGAFLKSMSFMPALVTSALMDLQTHRVTPHEIVCISSFLSEEEKSLLMNERSFAPARLRGVFEIICGEYGPSGK